MRYALKRIKDPVILNTPENVFTQNARYIKSARAEGLSDNAIRMVFLNGGWKSEDTNKAFELAQPM